MALLFSFFYVGLDHEYDELWFQMNNAHVVCLHADSDFMWFHSRKLCHFLISPLKLAMWLLLLRKLFILMKSLWKSLLPREFDVDSQIAALT